MSLEAASAAFEHYFQMLVDAIAAVLFFDIGGFPFIVLWLIAASVFFTLYLRGVNFRLFRHAFAIVSGKHNNEKAAGEVSHLQALLSALSATVGLGSLAGISFGVAIGGPGAVPWMVLGGLLGMATKFAEVCLSMCYRKIDATGKVYGGPFEYLRDGLSERGMAKAGKVLAFVFAIFCLGGALGGGNMFQSNQAVAIFTQTFAPLKDAAWMLSLGFAAFVFLVLIGSIKRVSQVAQIIVPFKGIFYLLCAVVIVAANIQNLPHAIMLMCSQAFTASAATGGFIGMLAIAFKRASFANEAGLGSAPIAHAAARGSDPVSEAVVALLEPFFAAMVALLTGLIVTISGAYVGAIEAKQEGIMIASHAFASVAPWFPMMLALNVLVFAYSTTIGWSYYGEIAWSFLFGHGRVRRYVYYFVFCAATFIGGVIHFKLVLDFSDLLILGMALPNIIGLYLLRGRIRSEMARYIQSLHKKKTV